MAEYTAYLERKQWIAPGISSNYTSAKCLTNVDSENDRESQEAKIDKRFVYAKSQTIQVLHFNSSDEAEFDYPYLGPCGKFYTTPLPAISSGNAIDIESLREYHREWCKKHPKLPRGIKLLSYTPEYKEEAGWYEYLTGPRTGQLWRHEPPLKKWKYKWVTNRVEVGIPTFSFTKGETLVKSSHPWTGIIQVEYYYDRAVDIKKKLKSKLSVQANYNFYMNPVGFDASGKEIDAFIMPAEDSSYWTDDINEIDCLICNPITGAASERGEPPTPPAGTMVDKINNARITHSTECTGDPVRSVLESEAMMKLSEDYANVLKKLIQYRPSITIDNSRWDPYNYTLNAADSIGLDNFTMPETDIFLPSTPNDRIELYANSYDNFFSEGTTKREFFSGDEIIFTKSYSKEEDPGEDKIEEIAFAYFMEIKKGLILNGNYDMAGAKSLKFAIWGKGTYLEPEPEPGDFRWGYVVVLDIYRPNSDAPVLEDEGVTGVDHGFTCSPECISKPCEWYSEFGYGAIFPCYVPWICALRSVTLFSESRTIASTAPQWGMERGFGDVDYPQPYIDLNEVNFTVSFSLSNVVIMMIPGEYFFFIYEVNFGEGMPCTYLYGPSGYFETHCMTSGIVRGCATDTHGGEGHEYDEDWAIDESLHWLVEYHSSKFWVRPLDFAKYNIGDRVLILKGMVDSPCASTSPYYNNTLISYQTVTNKLDDNCRVAPFRLSGMI